MAESMRSFARGDAAQDAVPVPPRRVTSMVDWAQVPLPDAWPDRMRWWQPRELLRLWRKLNGRQRERVQLPPQLPGAENLPRYLLLEFHNLPNGNYSRKVTGGYARGFDHAMLGTMRQGRQRVADALRGAERALDLGSGAGHLAVAMRQAGIGEVWGLEPSPYLLKRAAQQHPDVRWVQGVGEDSGLPDAHFDAVGICFVLHEVPPTYLRKLCGELRRITRPGARLAMLEPSPLQWRQGKRAMWKSHGWRGVYFQLLARRVYEPFAESWHKADVRALLAEYGFVVTQDETGCPFRFILAQRRD